MERPPVEDHLKTIETFINEHWPCIFTAGEVKKLCEYIQHLEAAEGSDDE